MIYEVRIIGHANQLFSCHNLKFSLLRMFWSCLKIQMMAWSSYSFKICIIRFFSDQNSENRPDFLPRKFYWVSCCWCSSSYYARIFFLHEPAAATAAAAWQDCIVFTDDENIAMPRMHSGLKIGGNQF